MQSPTWQDNWAICHCVLSGSVLQGSSGQTSDLPLCRGPIYPLGTLTGTSQSPPPSPGVHHSTPMRPYPSQYPSLPSFDQARTQVAILPITCNHIFSKIPDNCNIPTEDNSKGSLWFLKPYSKPPSCETSPKRHLRKILKILFTNALQFTDYCPVLPVQKHPCPFFRTLFLSPLFVASSWYLEASSN